MSQDDELLSGVWSYLESSDPGPCHDAALRRYFRPKVVSGVGCAVYSAVYSDYSAQYYHHQIASRCLWSEM